MKGGFGQRMPRKAPPPTPTAAATLPVPCPSSSTPPSSVDGAAPGCMGAPTGTGNEGGAPSPRPILPLPARGAAHAIIDSSSQPQQPLSTKSAAHPSLCQTCEWFGSTFNRHNHNIYTNNRNNNTCGSGGGGGDRWASLRHTAILPQHLVNGPMDTPPSVADPFEIATFILHPPAAKATEGAALADHNTDGGVAEEDVKRRARTLEDTILAITHSALSLGSSLHVHVSYSSSSPSQPSASSAAAANTATTAAAESLGHGLFIAGSVALGAMLVLSTTTTNVANATTDAASSLLRCAIGAMRTLLIATPQPPSSSPLPPQTTRQAHNEEGQACCSGCGGRRTHTTNNSSSNSSSLPPPALLLKHFCSAHRNADQSEQKPVRRSMWLEAVARAWLRAPPRSHHSSASASAATSHAIGGGTMDDAIARIRQRQQQQQQQEVEQGGAASPTASSVSGTSSNSSTKALYSVWELLSMVLLGGGGGGGTAAATDQDQEVEGRSCRRHPLFRAPLLTPSTADALLREARRCLLLDLLGVSDGYYGRLAADMASTAHLLPILEYPTTLSTGAPSRTTTRTGSAPNNSNANPADVFHHYESPFAPLLPSVRGRAAAAHTLLLPPPQDDSNTTTTARSSSNDPSAMLLDKLSKVPTTTGGGGGGAAAAKRAIAQAAAASVAQRLVQECLLPTTLFDALQSTTNTTTVTTTTASSTPALDSTHADGSRHRVVDAAVSSAAGVALLEVLHQLQLAGAEGAVTAALAALAHCHLQQPLEPFPQQPSSSGATSLTTPPSAPSTLRMLGNVSRSLSSGSAPAPASPASYGAGLAAFAATVELISVNATAAHSSCGGSSGSAVLTAAGVVSVLELLWAAHAGPLLPVLDALELLATAHVGVNATTTAPLQQTNNIITNSACMVTGMDFSVGSCASISAITTAVTAAAATSSGGTATAAASATASSYPSSPVECSDEVLLLCTAAGVAGRFLLGVDPELLLGRLHGVLGPLSALAGHLLLICDDRELNLTHSSVGPSKAARALAMAALFRNAAGGHQNSSPPAVRSVDLEALLAAPNGTTGSGGTASARAPLPSPSTFSTIRAYDGAQHALRSLGDSPGGPDTHGHGGGGGAEEEVWLQSPSQLVGLPARRALRHIAAVCNRLLYACCVGLAQAAAPTSWGTNACALRYREQQSSSSSQTSQPSSSQQPLNASTDPSAFAAVLAAGISIHVAGHTADILEPHPSTGSNSTGTSSQQPLPHHSRIHRWRLVTLSSTSMPNNNSNTSWDAQWRKGGDASASVWRALKLVMRLLTSRAGRVPAFIPRTLLNSSSSGNTGGAADAVAELQEQREQSRTLAAYQTTATATITVHGGSGTSSRREVSVVGLRLPTGITPATLIADDADSHVPAAAVICLFTNAVTASSPNTNNNSSATSSSNSNIYATHSLAEFLAHRPPRTAASTDNDDDRHRPHEGSAASTLRSIFSAIREAAPNTSSSSSGSKALSKKAARRRVDKERRLLAASGSPFWYVDGEEKEASDIETNLLEIPMEAIAAAATGTVPRGGSNNSSKPPVLACRLSVRTMRFLFEMPHAVPFMHRAALLRVGLAADKAVHRPRLQQLMSSLQNSNNPQPSQAATARIGLRIRRSRIYEDAFEQVMGVYVRGGALAPSFVSAVVTASSSSSSATTSASVLDGSLLMLLRTPWYVTFVNDITIGSAAGTHRRGGGSEAMNNGGGTEEAGIDAGGIFKEFMELVTQQCFDPARGLFASFSDRDTEHDGGGGGDSEAAGGGSSKSTTTTSTAVLNFQMLYPNPLAHYLLSLSSGSGSSGQTQSITAAASQATRAADAIRQRVAARSNNQSSQQQQQSVEGASDRAPLRVRLTDEPGGASIPLDPCAYADIYNNVNALPVGVQQALLRQQREEKQQQQQQQQQQRGHGGGSGRGHAAGSNREEEEGSPNYDNTTCVELDLHYMFVGLLLGKAAYEGIQLPHANLAPFFVENLLRACHPQRLVREQSTLVMANFSWSAASSDSGGVGSTLVLSSVEDSLQRMGLAISTFIDPAQNGSDSSDTTAATATVVESSTSSTASGGGSSAAAAFASMDDFATIDPEQYKGLQRLKRTHWTAAADVEAACLYCSHEAPAMGTVVVADLVPAQMQLRVSSTQTTTTATDDDANTCSSSGSSGAVLEVIRGRDIPVTHDNVVRYVHALVAHRLEASTRRQTAALIRGLASALPLTYIHLFNPVEFLQIIRGVNAGDSSGGAGGGAGNRILNVEDLRRHCRLVGGYTPSCRTIGLLWEVLAELDGDDQGRFLRFCTGSSRPPLLGFDALTPPFSIRRAVDEQRAASAAPTGGSFFNVFVDVDRLPTAATCFNLLKLPPYMNKSNLRDKLLQAIRSEAGFDLS